MIARPWVVRCDDCAATAEVSHEGARDARRLATEVHGFRSWWRSTAPVNGNEGIGARRVDLCGDCSGQHAVSA